MHAPTSTIDRTAKAEGCVPHVLIAVFALDLMAGLPSECLVLPWFSALAANNGIRHRQRDPRIRLVLSRSEASHLSHSNHYASSCTLVLHLPCCEASDLGTQEIPSVAVGR